MATFNYSTMQMTVKIVYYGPGLCGKTTNLQFIHNHTTRDTRGEMVSLETQTDRTLFFDLLPLEVGSIAGFKTRIQLYTVPGQVFYNTTRKLVLKGVDGVVFVADSQRPMLEANVESLKNLGINLAELGKDLAAVPTVFQYNKRDLPDVCTMEELDEALGTGGENRVEASALTGAGVFETLRAVSKLTLKALKRQLESDSKRSGRAPEVTADEPLEEPVAAALEETAPKEPTAEESTPLAAAETPAAPENGSGKLDGGLRLSLNRADLARTRRLALDLRFEDDSQQTFREMRDLSLDLDPDQATDDGHIRLSIRLQPED